ncbi:response regulator transcription factor [Dokdonella sp.]|uniref:response regulator transcription factor n=1 Tax=Dokdonella sp. TaxID=2291710 RepID=UPI003528D9B4
MNKRNQATVFVVDDDAGVRDSISELVESVGLHAECHASAMDFLSAWKPGRAGCLVLDVRMPDMSGLVLQRTLLESDFALPIIMLTGHGDVPIAVEAMKAGAFDFLQKPYREQALLDSVHAALSQDHATRQARQAEEELTRRIATLTPREVEVLDHVLAGETSKNMAEQLDMSPRTAEAHRRNLLHKLGIGTVKELLVRISPSVMSHDDPDLLLGPRVSGHPRTRSRT